jgi:hypothetical protein
MKLAGVRSTRVDPVSEAWMDWWLIYRNEVQVEQLAHRIDPTSVASCHRFRGGDRNVAYLKLVKGEG